MESIALTGMFRKTEDMKRFLDKAIEESGAKRCAYITDGSFTTDGLPSWISPERLTEQAILAGAGLVLRLPVIGVLSGPDTKAFATMSLCDRTGAFEGLAVPVHGIGKKLLDDLAMFLFKEPMAYQKEIRRRLDEGMAFAAARAEAAEAFVPGAGGALEDELDSYAVELRLSALRRYSTVKVFPVKIPDAAGQFRSEDGVTVQDMPDADRHLAEYFARFITERDERELGNIARMTPSCPWQVSESLVSRRHELAGFDSFVQLSEQLSSQKVPAEKVRRGLLMMLLGIRLPNLSIAGLEAFSPYVRVSGIREDASGSNREADRAGTADRVNKKEGGPASGNAFPGWLHFLGNAGVCVLSGDNQPLTELRPDDSRKRLASFDTAADRLREEIL